VRRFLCIVGRLATVVAALWLAGLGWFVVSSLAIRGDPTATTDAIVVLTGGKQRLETGIELLAAGKAKKLFISGVNPQVDRDALLHVLGPTAAQEACCIVLGHQADNTFENAQETAGWAQAEGYASLRLVTSWYHMRRSLLEFGRAMPRMKIVAQPVFATHVDPEGWWGRRGAVALVVTEYGKYLWALLRPVVDTLAPSPAAPVIRATASRDAVARSGQ
jgi:uncharacterized SAM-binding protein YcdF (DUF218 family)